MIIGIFIPLYFLVQMSFEEFFVKNEVRTTLTVKSQLSKEVEEKVNDYKQKNLDNNIKDPFSSENLVGASEVVGYLFIPKISSFQPLRLGASVANLERGVSHITGTSMPASANGRSIIAGHRSRINDLMFYRLNELTTGDKIYLIYNNKIFEYEVSVTKRVAATDTKELTTIYPNKNVLSLLTCDPVYPPFDYRLIVDSEFKSELRDINEVLTSSEVSYNKLLIAVTAVLLVLLSVVVVKYFLLEKKSGYLKKLFFTFRDY